MRVSSIALQVFFRWTLRSLLFQRHRSLTCARKSFKYLRDPSTVLIRSSLRRRYPKSRRWTTQSKLSSRHPLHFFLMKTGRWRAVINLGSTSVTAAARVIILKRSSRHLHRSHSFRCWRPSAVWLPRIIAEVKLGRLRDRTRFLWPVRLNKRSSSLRDKKMGLEKLKRPPRDREKQDYKRSRWQTWTFSISGLWRNQRRQLPR